MMRVVQKSVKSVKNGMLMNFYTQFDSSRDICLFFVWEYSPSEKTGLVPLHIKDIHVLSDWTSHGLSKVLTGSNFRAYTKS